MDRYTICAPLLYVGTVFRCRICYLEIQTRVTIFDAISSTLRERCCHRCTWRLIVTGTWNTLLYKTQVHHIVLAILTSTVALTIRLSIVGTSGNCTVVRSRTPGTVLGISLNGCTVTVTGFRTKFGK